MFESRKKLVDLNREIFKLFAERRSLVADISSHKSNDFLYDKKREQELFEMMGQSLRALSWAEVKAFSLLMEGQACERGAYPCWSKGEHCENRSENHHLNPWLLKVYAPEVFAELIWKEGWDE